MNIVQQNQEDSFARLEEIARRQLFWTKLGSLALTGVFVIVLVVVLVAAPRAGIVLARTEQAAASLEEVSRQLSQADLPGLLQRTDGLVAQSTDAAAAALQKIEELDVDSLNKAIEDLKNVVSPLAKLFGR